MKRIVIVSMSTGSGHVRCAKALESYIQKTGVDQVVHIDAADHIGLILKLFHIWIYGFSSRYVSWLWGFIYRKTNNKTFARFIQRRNPLQEFLAQKLQQVVLSYEPNVIICTYFGAAQLIKQLATKHNIPIHLVGTDYEAHALYVMKHISQYYVPTAQVKKELINFGADESSVHITGIPIDSGFFLQKNVYELRSSYNVTTDKKIVLIIANTYKKRMVKKMLKQLERVHHISIFIIGKGIKHTQDQRVKSIGWSKDVEDYMRIADVVITKSGGLTSTECMALGKNVIILRPIAGQEEANAAHLVQHGHGVFCKDIKKIDTLVKAYLDQPAKKMSEQQQDPSEIIIRLLNQDPRL